MLNTSRCPDPKLTPGAIRHYLSKKEICEVAVLKTW